MTDEATYPHAQVTLLVNRAIAGGFLIVGLLFSHAPVICVLIKIAILIAFIFAPPASLFNYSHHRIDLTRLLIAIVHCYIFV